MPKNWVQTLLALAVVGIGLLLTLLAGLHVYMTSTPPLHADPQGVPTMTDAKPSPEWTNAVDSARQIARAELVEQNLPGLSVAVGVGGAIVWAEGFGFADLETRVPVSPTLRFRIGTASTVLTSAAAGLLLEQGQLELDQEIQTYVPDFPKKEWPVTVRQLMAHTAGVTTDSGDEGPLFSQQCERPVDALPFFANRSLLFEPGTRYRYSSYGWILLSAAIEAASGERFFSFMRDRVFEPLGMADTRLDAAPGEITDRATSYFPRYSADPTYGPDLMRDLDLSCYAGAGAFVSTPSDLVRFGMGRLRQGSGVQGARLLKPETVQLLQTSQRLPSGEETGYGLGWDLESATLNGEPAHVVGHDGEVLGGMVASLMAFDDHDVVVAVISNTSYADTYSIGLKIAETFAAKPGRDAARK